MPRKRRTQASTSVKLERPTTPIKPMANGNDQPSAFSPISPWPPVHDRSPSPSPSPIPDNQSRRSTKRNGVPPIDTDLASKPAESHHHGTKDVLPAPKEIYGSIAILLTSLGYVVFLAWAILPERWLHSIGWTWYPDQQWALIIPCYLMLIVLLTYLTYAGITAYLTPSFDNMALITDPYSNIPPYEADPEFYPKLAGGEIGQAVDIPIEIVNRVLYDREEKPR